jgi:hypothetical protein
MAKRIEAKTPVVKEFVTWLDTSPKLNHLSWYTRFKSVIELWFAVITRNEAKYNECKRTLTNAGTLESTKYFGRFQLTMAEQPQDLLGEAYQVYSVRDQRNLAQYFTPDCVAECMARMSLGDMNKQVWRKPGGCRILEPTCGSGVMVIHALNAIRKEFGQWGLNRTEVVLCDVDLLCVYMAGIQLSWYPAPVASVMLLHGDSLSNTQTVVAHLGRGVAPSYQPIVRKVIN